MDKSPPSLDWLITVATEALHFFSLDSELRAAVQQQQGLQAESGVITPFSTMRFLTHLEKQGVATTGRRAQDLDSLLAQMAASGILLDAGSDVRQPLFGRCYFLGSSITRRQYQGPLWLAPVIGPELVIAALQPHVAHITGTTPAGDAHGASGLLLDQQHVLTAAHVVNDMHLDQVLYFQEVHEARILEVLVNEPQRDVALLRVELPPAFASTSRSPGLAFRDPRWADQVLMLGFPPVPMTTRAHLTVQTGEVVNPHVATGHSGEAFLYSAVARPGNSGGPIVAADGRILGLVTHELSDGATSGASPFFGGVPTGSILQALAAAGLGGVLPVEDWM